MTPDPDPEYLRDVFGGDIHDAWRRVLGDPAMPRFPLDAQVMVGAARVCAGRYELVVVDDGAHVVHRCQVHVDDMNARRWAMTVEEECR